ncbi:MAG: MATE family efflux transporter [Firmicutes bacterium]|nr:MATE family efflux transporter [Bacillota bacterium]
MAQNLGLEERRAARRDMMLNGNLLKVIPVVALPMIVTMLIDALYNLADTYFVSQLGITATAAVGVNDSLLHLMRSVALAFGMGAASPISKLMGAKREDEASKVASTSVFTCMMVLSILAFIAYIFRSDFVIFLGATEGAAPYAMEYATFILISAPFTAGEVTCSQTLRAEGSTTYSMIGMVSGCVINVGLDPLFIRTFGMGVGGAALATTISKAISFFILLTPFLRGKTLLELRFKYFTPKWEIYKEIAKMGIPTLLRSSVMSLSAVFINNMARLFGDAALAAVSVANKCARLVGSAVLGFGQGLQPIGGYCWGARRYARVRQAFWTCTAIGAVVAVVLSVVLFILTPNVLGIFMDVEKDAETLRIGTIMLRTQCATMFPHVWVMIINGLYQALGRPVEATILGLSRQVIFLIPAAFIMSRVWGVNGLACSQAAADVLSLIVSVSMVIYQMKKIKMLKDGDEPPAGYGLAKKMG